VIGTKAKINQCLSLCSTTREYLRHSFRLSQRAQFSSATSLHVNICHSQSAQTASCVYQCRCELTSAALSRAWRKRWESLSERLGSLSESTPAAATAAISASSGSKIRSQSA